MTRLHIFTDCEYFAGCERLLPLIWNSEKINESFQISFLYRKSKRYDLELNQFLSNSIVKKPVFKAFQLRQVLFEHKRFNGLRLNKFFLLLDQLLATIFIYPLFLYELAKLIYLFLKDKPNVLHINNGGYPGARSARAAACAGKICGVPTILMVVNNTAIPTKSLTRLLDSPIDFLVRRSISVFITASTHANEAIIKTLRLKPEQTRVIPNAVALADLPESRLSIRKSMLCEPATVVIGIVAVLEKRKGHQVFLEAMSIVKNQYPSLMNRVKVWIIGDGPLASSLKVSAKSFGIDESIEFLGYRYDYLRLVSAMDISILSSVSDEDSPLATIEAMSLGLPIIASDFAGLSDQVVNNESGFLFPVGDSFALANALVELIENQEIRNSMGKAALARYHACYSLPQFVDNYMSLYLRDNQLEVRQNANQS